MNENRCVITAKPRPDAVARLVVFPHAGGTSNSYRAWANQFGEDIQLDLVEYPGRGARMSEEPVTDYKVLVDEIVEALAQYEARTALFGHSMGSLLAFETARVQSSMGMPPEHLFVSASRAPSRRALMTRQSWTDEELIIELARYGGTPMEFLEAPDLRAILLGMLRTDYQLLNRYIFDPVAQLPVDMTAFYGIADYSVSLDDVSAWKSLTSGGFNAVQLSGGHFYDSSAIRRLCETVARVMGDVGGPGN